jgi:hypothetical protein
MESTMRPDAPDIVIGPVADAWVVVPNAWPFNGHTTPRAWALAEAAHRVEAARRNQRTWLADVLTTIAETTDENEVRALFLPDPGSADHMLVRIQYAFAEGDPASTLREYVGEHDEQAIDAVQVEEVTSAGLGAGYRAVRFHTDDDGAVLALLAYAFRTDPYDFRVTCADYDLTRLTVLTPTVEDFIDAIGLGRAAR